MSFSIKDIFLEAAATIDARGRQYDPSNGQERSMRRIVEAFNVLTNRDLTTEDGWLFMQLVKEVRQQISPYPHRDSMVDKLAYVLLELEERYAKLPSTCPHCSGTGRNTLSADAFEEEIFGSPMPSICEMCGGTGTNADQQ